MSSFIHDALIMREYISFSFPTKTHSIMMESKTRSSVSSLSSDKFMNNGRLNFKQVIQGSRWSVHRLDLYGNYPYHSGCINALSFNKAGDKLVSGCDNANIVITDWAGKEKLFKFNSGHKANVFQTLFLPYSDDLKILSASQDREVRLTTLKPDGSEKVSSRILCKHMEACHKLSIPQDSPYLVLSAGEDGVIYQSDTRDYSAKKILLLPMTSFNSISCNPANSNEFCVAGKCDVLVRVYDRRFLLARDVFEGYVDCFCVESLLPENTPSPWRYRVSHNGVRSKINIQDGCSSDDQQPVAAPARPWEGRTRLHSMTDSLVRLPQRLYYTRSQHRADLSKMYDTKLVQDQMRSPYHITHAVYSPQGDAILASYNDDDVYLFDVKNSGKGPVHRYSGHRNFKTIKGVGFFGPRGEYVVSGSDDGFVYIWDRKTERIQNWFHADEDGVVNVLESHPTLPVLATSGLDYSFKVWCPTRPLWQSYHDNDISGRHGVNEVGGHFGEIVDLGYSRRRLRHSMVGKMMQAQKLHTCSCHELHAEFTRHCADPKTSSADGVTAAPSSSIGLKGAAFLAKVLASGVFNTASDSSDDSSSNVLESLTSDTNDDSRYRFPRPKRRRFHHDNQNSSRINPYKSSQPPETTNQDPMVTSDSSCDFSDCLFRGGDVQMQGPSTSGLESTEVENNSTADCLKFPTSSDSNEENDGVFLHGRPRIIWYDSKNNRPALTDRDLFQFMNDGTYQSTLPFSSWDHNIQIVQNWIRRRQDFVVQRTVDFGSLLDEPFFLFQDSDDFNNYEEYHSQLSSSVTSSLSDITSSTSSDSEITSCTDD